MSDVINWKYPNPFVVTWPIQAQHIDHNNHVNNVAYLSMQEKVAWQHSRSLGLTPESVKALDRTMVIVRHELDYVKPVFLGDEVLCATWVVKCDGRVSVTREFQFVRAQTGENLYFGKSRFACIKYSTGQAARMPKQLAEIYQSAVVRT